MATLPLRPASGTILLTRMKHKIFATFLPCIGRIIFNLFLFLSLAAASAFGKSVVDEVSTMIGTAEHGHVYPGATVPFGMVQLSPDTRDGTWDGSSGYHYSDDSILGFSHNHLTGTGVLRIWATCC